MVFIQFLIRSTEIILFFMLIGISLAKLLIKLEKSFLSFYELRKSYILAEYKKDRIDNIFEPLLKTSFFKKLENEI